jgi:hypothetical protein
MATPKIAYTLENGEDTTAIIDVIERHGLSWSIANASTKDKKTGEEKAGRYVAPVFEVPQENGDDVVIDIGEAELRFQAVLSYYQDAYEMSEGDAWQVVLVNLQRCETTDLKNALRAQLAEDPATVRARRFREAYANAAKSGNTDLLDQFDALIAAAKQ